MSTKEVIKVEVRTHTITTKTTIRLTDEDIRRMLGKRVPPRAVVFSVPDWPGDNIDVDDENPIVVQWVITEEPRK